MKINCDLFKYNIEVFIELNANFSDLGSYYPWKGVAKIYTSSFTVVPSSYYICLCTGCSMGNVKSFYLKYEVSSDKFCDWAVTEINPVYF